MSSKQSRAPYGSIGYFSTAGEYRYSRRVADSDPTKSAQEGEGLFGNPDPRPGAWRLLRPRPPLAHEQSCAFPVRGAPKTRHSDCLLLAESEYVGGSTCSSTAGRVKKNVDPFPGSESAQMRPPLRSTIFWHIAKPMPVPSYSFPCRRRNTPKICVRYCLSIPIPLSRTEISQSHPCRSA